MKKLILTLPLFIFFILSVPAAHATTYYLSPSGSDSNNGSIGNPWLTPGHPVNCGDQIIAAASASYAQTNFSFGEWGTVTPNAAHCVAWLTCASFDACKINSTNGFGMFITSSHWGVSGWEVTASAGQAICFEAFPPTSSENIQDIVFANDIANGCYGAGFQPVHDTTAGVDYFVAVADIAYNASQQTASCSSGIDIYGPVQTDSEPGTHIFISQTFSWANVDPNPCAGGPPTDGVGVIFDTWDLFGYAAQGVMENNISFLNGSSGFRVDLTTQAPVNIFNNTAYGNNGGAGLNASWCGEIITQGSANVTAENNIAVTNASTGCGSWPVYPYYLADWSGIDTVDYNLGFSAVGNNFNSDGPSGFVFGANNVFGTDPLFASAPVTAPSAPSCGSYTSVITCMAPIIADFTGGSGTAGLGYQQVSNTPNNDPLFPSWLCPYSNVLSGLVTMGCGTFPASPASLTTLVTDTFTRAAADPLSGNWTISGSSCQLEITSPGILNSTLVDNCGEYYGGITWPNDQWGEVTVLSVDPTLTDYCDLGVDLRDSGSNTNYLYTMTCTSTEAHIYKQASGTYTSLVSTLSAPVLQPGDKVYGAAQGTSLSLYYCAAPCPAPPGTLILNVNDSSISSGSAGIYMGTSGVGTISSFSGGGFSNPAISPQATGSSAQASQ